MTIDRDLAIIGVACRFPGHSNNLEQFWKNLNDGNDCVTSTPADRWSKEFYVNASKEVPGRITTDRCGFVDHVYDFDYEAFQISKREAENMDPQQKVLLECTLQAFEDARIEWTGTNTGVYVGIGQAEQLELTTSDLEAINAYSVTGSALSIASNRISYCFDLRGPSISVDTACSSAMTAMHFAVQGVRNGECDQAVVAGVNLLMSPSVMIQFSKLGVMSPDGRCKSFTDMADGYVRSEGCGAVIIKPLDKALRDQNHIYGVIKGTAINQDGHQSPSLTLPNSDAQMIAFQAACDDSKIDARTVFFAEAHATGTKVGDPVEANAIGKVYGEGRPAGDFLRIGGVKTHVGHLECASYMAGLLKVLLMIQHETLVPNLYSGPEYRLNPAIEFDKYNMRVQSQHERFDAHGKLFTISSFGFGGANGCSIIQGYKPSYQHVPRALPAAAGEVNHTNGDVSAEYPEGPYLYLVSSATTAGLDARIKELQTTDYPNHPYELSYSISTRPLHRNVSVAVGNDLKSAVFAPAKKLADEVQNIVWVFAGQGPQHPEMGRTLYQRYPVFRDSINEMDAIYKNVSGESLVNDVGLFGAKRGDPKAVYQLQYTLPSLVFLQTALCDLWESLGVRPVAVFGHSFGEMAAAYAAGVCNKNQLIATAYHRARLLGKIDGAGQMMAIGASAELVQPWLDQEKEIWIAAYNGPNSITVGGIPESIAKIAAKCDEQNLFNRVLKITNAYHTPLLSSCHDEAIEAFRKTLAGTTTPKIPYFSTVNRNWMGENDQFDEHYTWAGIVGPVHFTEAVKSCMERYGAQTLFMEMSAHPVLSAYLTECGVKNSCMTLHRQQHEIESTFKTLAYLKIQGQNVDFKKLLGPHAALPTFLPYQFQYQFCTREDSNHRNIRLVPSWRFLAGREINGLTTTFEQKVSLKSLPWTADHVVQGPVIFPGAGYIEMCMEVLDSNSVGNINIGRAMIVNNDGNIYRTVRSITDEERKSVKIVSKVDQWDNGPWTQHVSATKTAVENFSVLPTWTNGLRERCSHEIKQKEVYERFKSVGLQYGPLFQGVTALYTGDNEAFGIMNVKLIHENSTKFVVHPALLDSTFHVLLGCIRYMYVPYVPTLIRRIQWFIKPEDMGETVYVYSRSTFGDNQLEGDIFITTTDGRIVGAVEGMQCTALGQTADKRPFQPTFIPNWQEYGVPTPFAPTRAAGMSTIPSGAVETNKKLDAAFVAYANAFLQAVRSSPNPPALSSLPESKQKLYAFLERVVANTTVDSSSIKSLSSISGFDTEVAAVQRIGGNLQDLLMDQYGVSKVFNDTLATDIYANSISYKPYVSSVAEQITTFLTSNPNRVVNILELGAGSLALASQLIPSLKAFTGRIRYILTDVTPKYVSDLKAKFSSYTFVDFKVVTLDGNFVAQGLGSKSFDFVLANDVLHTVTLPGAVTEQISSVLVPNGIVLAVESTAAPIWLQAFHTIFRGWNQYSIDEWRNAFTSANFHSFVAQTDAEPQFINTIISTQASAITVNAVTALPSNVVVFDAHVAENTLDKILELSQKHYDDKEGLDFYVVTSGSETIASSFNADSAEPALATFIGFARTWSNECIQHRIRIVDFETNTDVATRNAWLATLHTIAPHTAEREFAIRDNRVLVPRFVPFVPTPAKPAEATQIVAPYRLEVDAVGQISSLAYHQVTTTNGRILDHNADEVVIEVKAAALNFKDVMLALGMLNNPMGLDKKALRFNPPTAMGLECSGIIVATGKNVNRFKVGDEVFCICDHSLASQVVTHQNFVAMKPAHMTHVQAASLPIVFCTSYAGLIDKAHISAGETVLVHSAAGGIGQSSIQLCKHVGADVIATVGNLKKREYLTQRYGVTKFADSHSNAAWKADVMTHTNGEGVDACINSLKGDAIEYGLQCLKVGGRFVEIGKVDILADNNLRMGIFLKDLSFLSTQLDILLNSNSNRVSKYMTAISELASKQVISDLVDKVYPARDIEAAFRYLMAGQHMGKVMVDFSAEHLPQNVLPPSSAFTSTATYMISGGTGAVGLRVVQYMAEHGARYFILLSRRGVSSIRKSELDEIRALERFGVKVFIAKADVGRAADVVKAFEDARAEGHPDRIGLFHMAMVLEDDELRKQSPQRFANSLNCKVGGLRNLVNSFPKEKVECVVMFSSVSSVLGNPAQSNYAAGNSFLDSYCFYLCAKGYKAKTVNLGSIEDVGVLAEDYKLRMVLTMKGFAGGLTSYGVCQIIEAMLRDAPHNQYVHGSVEWPTVCDTYAIMTTRFQHLIDYSALNSAGGGGNDTAVTIEALIAAIAGLLEMNPEKLDVKEPLTRQGLDSLLAVELSSTLKKKFGLGLSQMELLGGMSTEDVFKHSQAM